MKHIEQYSNTETTVEHHCFLKIRAESKEAIFLSNRDGKTKIMA